MINKISVVIPVYQNEETIIATFRAVSDVLDRHKQEISYEFVLVNDGSTDRSWEILQKIDQKNPGNVILINFTRNFGQISALLAGYAHAKGECVVSMSADFQDPAELIWQMLCAWKNGNKLVVANRIKRNDGWVTNKISGFCWELLRRFAVPNIPKGGFDFFLMDRQLCEYFIRDPEQHIFLQGRLLFYGYEPFVIPYERKKRSEGKSQTSFGRRVKYLIDGFVGYSFLPLRIISIAGILLFFGSIISSCVIAWYVLVHGSRVEGWASLLIVILFLNGIQMMFIGIIGEYLWRSSEEIYNRPHYVIKDILKKAD